MVYFIGMPPPDYFPPLASDSR